MNLVLAPRAQDILDPNSFIAIEVYEARAAPERQEALPEVKAVRGAFEEILAGEPKATIFNVSSAEPAGS